MAQGPEARRNTMPVVSKDKAVKLLTKEVEDNLTPVDLLEVYNEMFPNGQCTENQAHQEKTPLARKIVDHLKSGLETEEIVDLWNLIIPKHRNVWYDEEEGTIHYREESEPLHAD
jgi:hypothetical protein